MVEMPQDQSTQKTWEMSNFLPWTARMEKGYAIIYFGHLKQSDYQIYLWKLSFEDGGDEFVARMTMNGDKVAGILITWHICLTTRLERTDSVLLQKLSAAAQLER